MKRDIHTLNEFFNCIRQNADKYSVSQRRIAQYLLTEPNLLTHLSVVEMAKVTQTSQATIIRFCKLLGYEGFLEFARHVKHLFQGYLTGTARFQNIEESVSRDLFIYGTEFSQFYFAQKHDEAQRLGQIIKSNDFIASVDAMTKAKDIFLLGTMGSYSLVYMFYNMLYRISSKVHMLEIGNTAGYNNMKNINEESVVFHVFFPRYPILSLDIATQAKEKNATIITLTNSEQSPGLSISNYNLIAPVKTMLFIDSFIEPLGVMTALALKFAQVNKDATVDRLSNYDHFIDDNNVFLK